MSTLPSPIFLLPPLLASNHSARKTAFSAPVTPLFSNSCQRVQNSLKRRDFKSLSLHIDAHFVPGNPLFSYSSQKRVGVFSKSVRSRDFRSDAQAFVGAACDIPRHKSQGEVGMPGRGSRAQACPPPGRPGLHMREVATTRKGRTKRVPGLLRSKRWGLSPCPGPGSLARISLRKLERA